MPMEVDSGAEISVVPFDAYSKYLNKFELKQSNRFLKYFDNSTPKVMGEVNLEITYKSKTVYHDLIVTKENNRTSLFGTDSMKIFDLSIIGIDFIKESINIDGLVRKCSDLFDGKLGKFEGRKIKLTVKRGTKPLYCKPHTIPFAFKAKVEKELKILEEQGIIEKVDTSE